MICELAALGYNSGCGFVIKDIKAVQYSYFTFTKIMP